MTLSELFGDKPLPLAIQELSFYEQAKVMWASQFDQIIKENRAPVIKTRIHVKKGKKNGR